MPSTIVIDRHGKTLPLNLLRVVDDICDADFGPVEKGLLGLLVRSADNGTGVTYPSEDTLARKLGTSPRSVRRALETLKRRGVAAVRPKEPGEAMTAWEAAPIRITRRHQSSLVYILNPARLAALIHTGQVGRYEGSRPAKLASETGQICTSYRPGWPPICSLSAENIYPGSEREPSPSLVELSGEKDGEREASKEELVRREWMRLYAERHGSTPPEAKDEAKLLADILRSAGGDVATAAERLRVYLAGGDD
jgi:hypothetical protein